MTLSPGLVSVTFRQLSVQDIVNLTARAGLDAIEWGGDVHVPHGDLNAARAARIATEHAGLRVAAYGSYYRAGHADTGPFEDVLASAVELGAPCIRIWAGRQGSGHCRASLLGLGRRRHHAPRRTWRTPAAWTSSSSSTAIP